MTAGRRVLALVAPMLLSLSIALLLSCSETTEPTPRSNAAVPSLSVVGATETAPVVRMIGAGDISSCSNQHDSVTAEQVVGYLAEWPDATVYTLGDNVYEDGTAAQYANCYDPTWGRFKASTRPALGNHDYHTSGAQGSFDYFGSLLGPPGRGYYSYDLGAWHVVVLNSNNSDVPTEIGSEQQLWLENDLATNTKGCILAYWHHPRFYSTSSGSPGLSNKMKQLWIDLYEAGATLILNGHEHHYERYAPQDVDGRPTPRGIRQFIVGTAGSVRAQPTVVPPNGEVQKGRTRGVMELLLGDGWYSWNFIAAQGDPFTDSGTGACVDKNANYPPTARPGGPYTGTAGEAITFSDDGSFDADGNGPLSFVWDFGDGTVASGASVTHNYASGGSYTATLTVTDELGASSAPAPVSVTVDPAGTVKIRVAASSDDAEESASGSVSVSSGDLELMRDGSNQTVGLRFNSIPIPSGATITRAYVQFQVDEASSEATSLTIGGEASDNAVTFSSSAKIASRPRTTSVVAWSPPPWTTVGEEGVDQQTPDLSSIVQDIVGRSGWQRGNSLALVIWGTGRRVAKAYNASTAAAPLLRVEYSIGPNTAPTATDVAIWGKAEVGRALTGTYTYGDAERDAEGASTYRWLRDGAPIAEATARSYTLTTVDEGALIAFEVTPVAANGTSPGTAVQSAAVGPVAAAPPNSAPTASGVTISGTARVRQTLTGNYVYADPDGDPEGASTYVWLRDGVPIEGATARSYTLVTADQGRLIHFEVTPIAAQGSSPGAPVQSATVGPIGSEPTVLELRVAASSDDAEELASGSMYLNSTDLELVRDGSNQTIGLRFNGVAVPQGATITRAYIQFRTDETSSETTSLTLRGEAADNAVAFSSADRISPRARTVSAVSWSPPSWSTSGQAGASQQTPDLAAIIQEIVSRAGWQSGNSLAIIIVGSGRRVAEAFDGMPAAAPLLRVEFSTSSPP